MVKKMQAESISRWMIINLTVVSLVLASGGGWFYNHQKQTAWRWALERLAAIGAIKADQLAAWSNERLGDATMLRGNLTHEISLFATHPSQDNAKTIRSFFRSLQQKHQYEDILLVNPEGRLFF